MVKKCVCPKCLMTHHLNCMADGSAWTCECGLEMQVDGHRVVYFPNGRGMMWLDRLLIASTVILVLTIAILEVARWS